MTTGYDTTWELETAEGSGVFQELQKVRSGGFPNEQRARLDASHMKSPNHTMEFESGFIDPGEVQLVMLWEPASATDELIVGWKAAGDKRTLRCVTPGGDLTAEYLALYGGYETPLEHDAVAIATLTVYVAGAVERS